MAMTIERWQQVKRLFAGALLLEDQERRAYLEQEGAADQELLAEVEQLLLQYDKAESRAFLKNPVHLDDGFLSDGTDAIGVVGEEEATQEFPTLIGDHEILEVTGQGGMGVVYKARHRKLGRLTALKMIRAGTFASPDDLARFRTEAEAAAHLKHARIVPVYEVGEHEGCQYYSMAFIAGQTLRARLREGPLPATNAAELMVQIAEAVHVAHEQGIVHRDLKPSNVLLDEDGVPNITDFGIAKRLEGDSLQTRTGDVLGTPSYMSPEQATGKSAESNATTDVYSLGAILYETLTGRPPFQGASVMETLDQVRHDDPVSPRILQPKLSRDLDTICLKCLRKSREERYASAKDLAEDLQRYLQGRPIAVRPIGNLKKSWKWVNRNRGIAAAVSTAFVALVSLVVVSWVQLTEVKREKERGDSNLYLARKAAFDTAWRLLKHRQFRESPEFQDLREELLAESVAFYDEVIQQVSDDPLLEAERGRAYLLLVNARSDIGLKDQALANTGEMMAIFEKLVNKFPENEDYRCRLGWSFAWKSILLRDLGQPEQAKVALDKAINILTDSLASQPEHAASKIKLGACYIHRGTLADGDGDRDGAFRWYQQAFERLNQKFPPAVAELEDHMYFLNLARARSIGIALALEQWDFAAVVLKSQVRNDPQNADEHYKLALAYLAANKLDKYRQTCAGMLERFGDEPELASRIVYACVAGPGAVDDLQRLRPLAKQAVTTWPGHVRLLAAASYRIGNYDAASRYFEQTPNYAIRAWDYYFAAMAYAQVGQTKLAEECLMKATAWISEHSTDGQLNLHWTEQVEIKQLSQEWEEFARWK